MNSNSDRSIHKSVQGSYELVGKKDEERDLSFIHNGKVYENKLVLKKKGESDDTASIAKADKVLCMTGDQLSEPGEIIEVTKEMVNAYWETEKTKSEQDTVPGPKGSYSKEKRYERDKEEGPSEQYNCAAYAISNKNRWIEPEEMHKILTTSYKEVASDEMVEGEDYVGATQHHFFGLKKIANNEYQTSEKNGASAVYHRILDQKDFNKLINDTYASLVKIYKKKI